MQVGNTPALSLETLKEETRRQATCEYIWVASMDYVYSIADVIHNNPLL